MASAPPPPDVRAVVTVWPDSSRRLSLRRLRVTATAYGVRHRSPLVLVPAPPGSQQHLRLLDREHRLLLRPVDVELLGQSALVVARLADESLVVVDALHLAQVGLAHCLGVGGPV